LTTSGTKSHQRSQQNQVRKPGKLDLNKLVELYKENPRLERPTLQVEFAIF